MPNNWVLSVWVILIIVQVLGKYIAGVMEVRGFGSTRQGAFFVGGFLAFWS